MISKIIEFLQKREWKFTQDSNIIRFPVSHFNATYNCVIDIREERLLMIFLSFGGTFCPPEKQQAVINLFNRMNTSLGYGNFELATEEGQGLIKFRTSNFFTNTELDDSIIDKVIDINTGIIDFSMPYILKVIFGGMDVDEAFKELAPQPNLITENVTHEEDKEQEEPHDA
ncbi:MAG: hypothetical protein ABJB05_00010 [Parafilimonas sp.]